MSDQARVRFESLFAVPLRNGVSYPARLRGSGIPMVNMKEIFAFDRIGDEECELVPLTEREMQNSLLESGDLLFARQSLTFEGAGKCVLVADSSRVRTWESHLIRVRLDSRLANPTYFYYYFRSPMGRRSMESIIQQVAAAGVKGSDLRRLDVPCPPLEVQLAVGEVLGAIDDKIAANSKLAAAAEALLAAEFQSLGSDEEVGARDARVMSDYFELNPTCPRLTESDPVYVDMQKLPTDGMLIADWASRPAKGGARFMNGDTLLARITPCLQNRKTGYVDFLDEGQVAIGSTEYIVIRSKPGVPRELSYFLATSEKFRSFAIRHMVGTSGRQRLSANDLADYPINDVDPSALDRWGTRAAPLVARLGLARDESRTLAATRDALLPRLMSGELRVRDAERQVEAVL
ncbi:hypothetical protein [Rhodococcus sp. BE178]|uniref:hypothetical protein n=1 Tax=Rhodococcus sp. BE178 TaxID=2817737 RepID=UPI003D1A3D34